MDEMTQDQLFGSPVGERLRAAREDKGLSLEDVARQTRIPIRHLEHIERGEWDALPAITYSVGFARSYANVVGLDGPAIGAELREQLGGLPRGQSSAPPYYEPADPARVPPRSLAILTLVIAIVLVGAYLIWRNNAVDDPSVEETPIVDAPAQPRAPARPPTRTAPATGPVTIAATEEVWLRIYEQGGPKLYEGTLRAGERYQIPANARAPQIRTGRPNAIQVTVGSTAIPPLGAPEQTIDDVSLRPADLLARTSAGAAPPPPTTAPPAARP